MRMLVLNAQVTAPLLFFFFFPFFKGLVEKKEEFEMILGVDIYIVALQMELGGNL